MSNLTYNGQQISQREDRLCNGMMMSIWVYLDSPELEVVIHDYFNPEVY